MKKLALLFTCTLLPYFLLAQSFTQTIRGKVIDKDTQQPLIGATVTIKDSTPLIGSQTDAFGNYILEDVPVI